LRLSDHNRFSRFSLDGLQWLLTILQWTVLGFIGYNRSNGRIQHIQVQFLINTGWLPGSDQTLGIGSHWWWLLLLLLLLLKLVLLSLLLWVIGMVLLLHLQAGLNCCTENPQVNRWFIAGSLSLHWRKLSRRRLLLLLLLLLLLMAAHWWSLVMEMHGPGKAWRWF